MTEKNLRDPAFALYKPPFRYECGYIFDAENRMVADQHETSICRVRGLRAGELACVVSALSLTI